MFRTTLLLWTWANRACRQRWRGAWFVALVILPVLSFTDAYGIKIKGGEQQCFYENVANGASLLINWVLIGGDKKDIDFTLSHPNGSIIAEDHSTESGLHLMKLTGGRYAYCFRNMNGAGTPKDVTFVVHNRPEHSHEALSPLANQIEELKLAAELMIDDQEYIVARDRAHRDTAENTNSRVVWWSLIQTTLLVAVCFFQIWYIRRTFEVKRII